MKQKKEKSIDKIIDEFEFEIGIRSNRPRIIESMPDIPVEERPQIVTLKQWQRFKSSLRKELRRLK